jgi:hypothetical protein
MPKIPYALIYGKIFKRIYCKINKGQQIYSL